MLDLTVIGFFAASRIISYVAMYLASLHISYLGNFPYYLDLPLFHVPQLIYSLANFDGIHYIKISSEGYAQYTQAFFPLYPLLIHYVSYLFDHNGLIAALFISNTVFLFALIIFKKYLKEVYPKTNITTWATIYLLTFPTAFFFMAAYTESLFFFLFIASLYFLIKKRYLLSAIFAFLLGLTRISGVFIVIPIVLHLLVDRKKKTPITVRALLPFFPVFGLITYMIYLWMILGDPLYFLTAQPAFGANRSSHIVLLPQVIYRYLKIFVTASHSFQYHVALLEFSVFIVVFFVLLYDLYRLIKKEKRNRYYGISLGINLYSIATIILPTLTGTFSSLPRYALLATSFFIALSHLKSPLLRIFIIVVFTLLQALLLGLFIQGYFIS